MPGVGGEDVDLFGRRPRGRPDWSHRRGEPRGLALAWALYLMLAMMGSLMPAMTLGRFDPDVFRPAARVLSAVIVVGLVVLWPMLRLSQRPAGGVPGGRIGRDLVVLLIPAMTLVWPQVLLAGWSIETVSAVSALLVVWSLVAASGLSWWRGCGGEKRSAGVAVMVLLVLLVAGLPPVLWRSGVLEVSPAGRGVTPGWMWTPVTSVLEILRDRSWSGHPADVSAGHWVWIVRLLVGASGLLWLTVWCRGRGGARLPDRRRELEQ